jgi:tyrosine aminotransferase
LLNEIKENADIVYKRLKTMPGLKPRKSSGAMYLMCEIDFKYFPEISNDMDFAQRLISEQSVFCLPASVIISFE